MLLIYRHAGVNDHDSDCQALLGEQKALSSAVVVLHAHLYNSGLSLK
jgi:hypothetical protein